MPNNAITVSEITKIYKRSNAIVKALDSVSFGVSEGEIFGLIGPDGAGKTTMFRIITTLILPNSGKVEVLGFDAQKSYREIRQNIGYMAGRFSLYQDLTVKENLDFFAKIFGVKIEDNFDLISDIYSQIEPFNGRLAGRLSGGMKQKLALCCALIHRPKLLVLDEPTTGVDPVSRQELWEILRKMKASGISILVSTPYMDEAMKCDKMAFLVNGKILRTDTPQNIINSFSQKIYHIKTYNTFKVLETLRKLPQTQSAYSFGDTCHLCLKDGAMIEDIENVLKHSNFTNFLIEESKANLEDCFMELTKNDND